MVHTERMGHAGGLHLLASLLSRELFVLTEVYQSAELAERVAAGVDRDDRNPGSDGAPDRRAERRGIGNTHYEPIDLRRDRGIDELAHGRKVKGGRCLVVGDHI